MGTIQQKWQEDKIRIEDGIFFGSDECVALVGEPETGYTIGARQPMAGFIATDPDGWCDVVETVTVRDQSRDLIIHAGETSWEGEGFIAAVTISTSRLLWLFHLSASEPFVKVVADGENIRAVSDGYPTRYEWCIPIYAPENFTVGSCSED